MVTAWGSTPEKIDSPSIEGWGATPAKSEFTAGVEGWWPKLLKYLAAGSFTAGGQLATGIVERHTIAPVLSASGVLGASSAIQDGLRALVWAKYTRSFAIGSATGSLAASYFLRPMLTAALTAGPGNLAATISQKVTQPTALTAGPGNLVVPWSFPAKTAVTTTYTATGAYTYTIPWWCTHVDVIMVGAGGGGTGGVGAFTNGNGGGQNTAVSQWVAVTLVRGVDFPWSATQITGVVGAGGAGSPGAVSAVDIQDPSPGGASTAAIAGGASLSAAGGLGGTTQVGFTNRTGLGPGNKVLDGITYTGGADTTSATPNVPGSGGWGGAGGFVSGQAGNPGGRGQVWLRAKQA